MEWRAALKENSYHDIHEGVESLNREDVDEIEEIALNKDLPCDETIDVDATEAVLKVLRI